MKLGFVVRAEPEVGPTVLAPLWAGLAGGLDVVVRAVEELRARCWHYHELSDRRRPTETRRELLALSSPYIAGGTEMTLSTRDPLSRGGGKASKGGS